MSSLHFGTLMIISIMQIGSIREKKIWSIDNRHTDVEQQVFINLKKGKKPTY